MKCNQVEELLWALCEGVLDKDRVYDIEGHLSSCQRCRTARQQISRTMEAVRCFGSIEPRGDFRIRLWERIDAWEASRQVLWLGLIASFVRRNRRVIATCCLVFTISLFGGIFALRNLTRESAQIAESPGFTEDYAIRDIEPTPFVSVSSEGRADTFYTRFVTREFAVPPGPHTENYVFEPVVAPVSGDVPAF
jgi:hypothetical protein